MEPAKTILIVDDEEMFAKSLQGTITLNSAAMNVKPNGLGYEIIDDQVGMMAVHVGIAQQVGIE